MKKRIEVIIQARMGSTRLPGKVMLELCGRPVLWHVLERVKQAKLIDDILVATTIQKNDDLISDYLQTIGINCFRGDEKDVLSRYYNAARQYPANAIVRITADCPLIDPQVMDQVIACFLTSCCEYATNTGEESKYPRGLDCEIFTGQLLERAFREATEDYEREHVTPFMYWKQDKIMRIANAEDYSDMRWTLDTSEDFQLIQAVYRHFYHGKHDFYLRDIYWFIKNHPELYQINHSVKQKPVK